MVVMTNKSVEGGGDDGGDWRMIVGNWQQR